MHPQKIYATRLTSALAKQGITVSRAKVIEILAATFGYRNSHELTNASKAGEITPLPVAPIGRLELPDGQAIVVVTDQKANAPYAIDESFLAQIASADLGERYSPTPYGHLADIGNLTGAPLPTLGAVVAAASSHPLDGRDVIAFPRDALRLLVGATDSYLDDLETGLNDGTYDQDEGLSEMSDALALARDRLALEPPADTSAIATAYAGKLRVYVARRATKYGDSTYVNIVETALYDEIAKDIDDSDWEGARTYLAENALHWDPDFLPVLPSDRRGLSSRQVVDLYFEVSDQRGDDSISHEMIEANLPNEITVVDSKFDPSALPTVMIERPDFLSEIASTLEAGMGEDIFFHAHDFSHEEDGKAARLGSVIEDTQWAMTEAVQFLRQANVIVSRNGSAAVTGPVSYNRVNRSFDDLLAAQKFQPLFLTDENGCPTEEHDASALHRLMTFLRLEAGADESELHPLSGREESLAGNRHSSHLANTLFGRTAVFKGRKFFVPEVSFPFEIHDEIQEATNATDLFIKDRTADIEALGGFITVQHFATESSHEVAIFIPFETADQVEPCDWHRALDYLLLPSYDRQEIPEVTATFRPQAWIMDNCVPVDREASLDYSWNATFDLILQGRQDAESLLAGEIDADSFKDSLLAPQWVRDWSSNPFEVDLTIEPDTENLAGLFGNAA